MKTIHSLLIASFAGFAITSCAIPDGPAGHGDGRISSTFGVFDVLPSTYAGEAYYCQNRYYYGGNYQRGVFHNHGRRYSDRYLYGGQYYYGGRNVSQASRGQKSHSQDSRRGDHRDADHR